MLQERKHYWLYDDGKVTPSRQEIVRIDKVYRYSELPRITRVAIQSEMREHDYLYNDCQVIVAIGTNLTSLASGHTEEECQMVFLESHEDGDEGWFGFGMLPLNSGRIDHDGRLTQHMNECDCFDVDVNSPLFPTDEDINDF